jgi:hypothetical protein
MNLTKQIQYIEEDIQNKHIEMHGIPSLSTSVYF